MFGTEGSASFDSISTDEFHVFQAGVADAAYNGPRRIFTGPAHPYLSDVASMSGVSTGYAEAFTAEIQEFLRAVEAGTPMDTTLATATQMMNVVGAALESSRTGKGVAVPSVQHPPEGASILRGALWRTEQQAPVLTQDKTPGNKTAGSRSA